MVALVMGCEGLARDRVGCRGDRGGGEAWLQRRISATLKDCNLFPLAIGLEEHQEPHVQPDK